MNLWFRVIGVLFSSLFRPRLGLLGESRLDFRVWPFDLDINIHMNNARYLALMDLGRLDIILRSGLGRLVLRQRLQPVIASALVRYRRSLLPFERFTLCTRLLGWDEKWLFIEHRLERRGDVVCQAVVKGLFLGRDGAVPSAELVGHLNHHGPGPALPPWIDTWMAAEAAQAQPV
jgi:acyl-CoA thioesterase FadM